MIHGIGTDIATIARFSAMLNHHGDRALGKCLAPKEQDDCRTSAEPARFLAKRFAAKEALGKALGTGIRNPVLLPSIEIIHDALGKPGFRFHGTLAEYISHRHLICHLSISDEKDQALAFVVVEQP
ncbi:MAG: holo-ACP synthase [Rhodocyclaceae bacterium]|nr:MAG: holo-ACP synthase [Rhodocyclaceae bacterium]